MPIRLSQMTRDCGAAIAVLAIYMLVLLAPMHQMAGLQRVLAPLGFESSLSWSVCTSVADQTDDSGTPLAAKCPLAGVGKFEPGTLPPSAHPVLPESVALVASFEEASSLLARFEAGTPGQPRAPPVRAFG